MARHTFLYLSVLSALVLQVLPEPTSPGSAATPAPAPAPSASPAESRADEPDPETDEPPEGYYAFVESPNATPPRVRPPPYRQVPADCAGSADAQPHVSANNLCGDLNRGIIPRNPMSQSPNGEPYPFELIRNQTLRFLSRTLPVLRNDDTLPRVKHLPSPPPVSPGQHYAQDIHTNDLGERGRRSLSLEESSPAAGSDSTPSHALRVEHRAVDADTDTPRESRKFCDGGGVFCMLYRAFNGDSEASVAGVERREDPGTGGPSRPPPHHRYEGPPTPCPARVEYATPVFARNYQGVWRYVVQIPYEGYFTQTVEVTRCMQSRCHYLEGGCLSSPRWVSLLVAELHYPPSTLPQHQDYQQYLQKRVSYSPEAEPSTEKPPHCDGHDELGCFQVRLYYDWFLVPGSCKCWRPDYFAKYVRRARADSPDL